MDISRLRASVKLNIDGASSVSHTYKVPKSRHQCDAFGHLGDVSRNFRFIHFVDLLLC